MRHTFETISLKNQRRCNLPTDRSVNFVNHVIKEVNDDRGKGFGAKLRKADNENTEYQSWEILSRWVNLEWESDRKAFALIGASIARVKPVADGKLSIGEALRMVHLKDKDIGDLEKSSSALRLRRILACKEKDELMDILKPVVRYVESSGLLLQQARLLDEILWFNNDESRERTRAKWARDFFRKKEES
ncbi:MAG TPA: type I-E CRISPR-associated protein Cse2/CasB [Sphaerochaeta sp.]|nr:type I-E CRISPR-associated protein Cse2/CasB [Sphaerochaeta sp.]